MTATPTPTPTVSQYVYHTLMQQKQAMLKQLDGVYDEHVNTIRSQQQTIKVEIERLYYKQICALRLDIKPTTAATSNVCCHTATTHKEHTNDTIKHKKSDNNSSTTSAIPVLGGHGSDDCKQSGHDRTGHVSSPVKLDDGDAHQVRSGPPSSITLSPADMDFWLSSLSAAIMCHQPSITPQDVERTTSEPPVQVPPLVMSPLPANVPPLPPLPANLVSATATAVYGNTNLSGAVDANRNHAMDVTLRALLSAMQAQHQTQSTTTTQSTPTVAAVQAQTADDDNHNTNAAMATLNLPPLVDSNSLHGDIKLPSVPADISELIKREAQKALTKLRSGSCRSGSSSNIMHDVTAHITNMHVQQMDEDQQDDCSPSADSPDPIDDEDEDEDDDDEVTEDEVTEDDKDEDHSDSDDSARMSSADADGDAKRPTDRVRLVKSNSQMVIHKTSDGSKWKCNFCRKWLAFESDAAIFDHVAAHDSERQFKCEFCSKKFKRKADVARHMKTHTGDKPHKCEQCGRGFGTRYCLKTHQRTHSGDKPYECSYCDKSFRQNSHLIVHWRTHTGDKPYECKTCHKRFSQHSTLAVHQRIHQADKPFVCPCCKRGFTQRHSLQRHIKNIHKPYFEEHGVENHDNLNNVQKEMDRAEHRAAVAAKKGR